MVKYTTYNFKLILINRFINFILNFDTISNKKNQTLVLKVSDKVGNSNEISVNYSQE